MAENKPAISPQQSNYVSAAGLAAAGKAVIIGERFGIDPETIIKIINASTGRNKQHREQVRAVHRRP